jgi:hypothetical protein
LDVSGNIFIADPFDEVIRKIDHSAGIITTVAGNNAFGKGYSGDGGLATSAELNEPSDVVTDSSGNIYVADLVNNVIRKVSAITTAINEVPLYNCVYLYPNPNNGKFIIEFSHPDIVSASQTKIEIYNVFGERIYGGMLKQVQHDYEINLSTQSNGVYFLQLITQQGSISRKIVIEK